jgi:hypothetical protein
MTKARAVAKKLSYDRLRDLRESDGYDRFAALKNDMKCPDHCDLVRRILKQMQTSSM